MSLDKITPNDPRIVLNSTEVEGHRWYWLDAAPTTPTQKGTVVLIHGFPDQALAWRYQIPMLTSLGLRCIALQCMGYGDTGTSPDLHAYGFKSHATAIAGICSQQNISSIIIGGHDWGGAVVYRVAQWYPRLVSHVFAVCTPYFKVFDEFVSTENLIAGGVRQFGYQLQFGSEARKVEGVVRGRERVGKFLRAMYGGRVSSGRVWMTPEEGVDLGIVEDEGEGVEMTPLLSEEELDYYVDEFMKTGLEGPCNWYRTRRVNFEDEKDLPAEQRKGVSQPTLFIQALRDNILTPELAKGMEKAIPNLTRGEVNASHWALWHTPKETNEIIQGWLEGVVFGGKNKL